MSEEEGMTAVSLALASRFVCIYFALYCLPTLTSTFLSLIPVVGDWYGGLLDNVINGASSWAAVHLFHLSGPVTVPHPTGSGDTTLDYIQSFVWLVLAAILTLIWSAIGRLRRLDIIAYPWVRLVIRFTLAYTLMSYGFGKLFPNQFPQPDVIRLTETYGESSPMGLMWAFMGASPVYEMFCGFLEAFAGMLLLFLRTSTIGALLGGAVMFNIFVLNMCFDVPVKLYSLHLFLMSLFLLAGDLRKLWDFFVLRREAKLEGVWVPAFERRWLRYTRLALQIVVPAYFLFLIVPGEYRRHQSNLDSAKQRASILGVWELDADAVNVNGDLWRRVMIDEHGRTGARAADGQLLRFMMTPDFGKHKFSLKGWRNEHQADFSYERVDEQHLVLRGKIDDKGVELRMHRIPQRSFLLTTRGFHWISEDPYNL
jgi:hypothetical protein